MRSALLLLALCGCEPMTARPVVNATRAAVIERELEGTRATCMDLHWRVDSTDQMLRRHIYIESLKEHDLDAAARIERLRSELLDLRDDVYRIDAKLDELHRAEATP